MTNFTDLQTKRRSIYALGKDVELSNQELIDTIQEAVLNTPEEDEDEKADIDPKENTGKEPRLAPQDIRSYVDSLKNAIPYWYLTYYPNDGASLNYDEKICLDRLNRIGIGYFRPLVIQERHRR